MGSKVLLWGGLTSFGRNGITIYPRVETFIENMTGAVYDTEKDLWTMLPASPSLGEEWNVDDLDDTTLLVWGEKGLATYRLGDTEWKSLPNPGIPRRSHGHRIHTVGTVRILSYFTFLPDSSQSQHHFGPLYDAARRAWIDLPTLRKNRAWIETPRGLMLWGGGDPGWLGHRETKRRDTEALDDGAFLELPLRD
jgi:hypothetical protein